MKLKFLFLGITTLLLLFITGCVGGNSAGTSVDTDKHSKVRDVVWN
jgi:hypothetical protein